MTVLPTLLESFAELELEVEVGVIGVLERLLDSSDVEEEDSSVGGGVEGGELERLL